MASNTITRFALVPLIVFMSSFQCSQEHDDPATDQCDCQTASTAKKQKDVEAVVVLITSYQDQDLYVLSTEPKDFGTTSHTAGRNILVPCDSLPAQYRQAGVRLIISYRRKDCYGALTAPTFRSSYGYYVNLSSVRINP